MCLGMMMFGLTYGIGSETNMRGFSTVCLTYGIGNKINVRGYGGVRSNLWNEKRK